MSDFDRDLESRMDALFRSAREDTEAAPGDEVRVRRALAAKLGAAVVMASAAKAHATVQVGARAAGAATQSIHLALLAKAAPVGLLAAVGVWAAAAHTPREPASMPSMVSTIETHAANPHQGKTAPAPHVVTATAPTPLSTSTPPLSAPAPVPRREPAPLVASPVVRKTDSTLADEVTLVARMHESWRSGDLASVDRLVDEHRRRFAHGILEEEREAMKAMRACLRAPRGHRIEIARDFSERYPSSPHVARVFAACSEEAR